MTLTEAKELAQKGEKVCHKYFLTNEYLTMKGNMIIFEDGSEILFDEWVKNKPYLQDNWKLFNQ